MNTIDSQLGLDKTVQSAMGQQLGEQGLDVAIVNQEDEKDEIRERIGMPMPNPKSDKKNFRIGLITIGVIAGIIYISTKK